MKMISVGNVAQAQNLIHSFNPNLVKLSFYLPLNFNYKTLTISLYPHDLFTYPWPAQNKNVEFHRDEWNYVVFSLKSFSHFLTHQFNSRLVSSCHLSPVVSALSAPSRLHHCQLTRVLFCEPFVRYLGFWPASFSTEKAGELALDILCRRSSFSWKHTKGTDSTEFFDILVDF